ncbi:MAG: hypothetical protein LC122_12255 [Chitinophagales bacterium]|nr:hypothetical protein [Chitinophagales bacterium]
MKVLYTYIGFSDEVRELLLNFCKTKFVLHSKLYLDHITLNYYSKQNLFKEDLYKNGEDVKFNVVGFIEDDKCQALVCELPENIICSNKIPHITVACNDIAPKYSNELLLKKEYIKIEKIELTGKIHNKTV